MSATFLKEDRIISAFQVFSKKSIQLQLFWMQNVIRMPVVCVIFFSWVDWNLHSRWCAIDGWFQIKWSKYISIILLHKVHSSYWQIFNFQINKLLFHTFKSNGLLSLWNSCLQMEDWPKRLIYVSVFLSFFPKSNNIYFNWKYCLP